MLSMAVAAACNINMARENGFWIIVFNAFPCTSGNKYLTVRNTQGVPDTEYLHKSVVLPWEDSISQYHPLQ